MTATSRSLGRHGVCQVVLAKMMIGAALAVIICGAGTSWAAVTSKAEVRAAEKKIDHAEDAVKDAERTLKKQRSELAKAQKACGKLEKKLADLNKEFAAADENKKDKLAGQIRDTQEKLRSAVRERANTQTDVARTEKQVEMLKTNVDSAEKKYAALKQRREKELVAWKQRESDAAKSADTAVTKTAQATTTSHTVRETTVKSKAVAQTSARTQELQQEVQQAEARRSQAQAVVEQRTEDLENAKDAEAREKAQSALRNAEKYAQKQNKEYQEALSRLEKAQKEPPARLAPRTHTREQLVSEPAPWAPPAAPQAEGQLRAEQQMTTPEAQAADIAPAGQKLQFDLPMIAGDKEIVEDLDVWQEWAGYITFNPVTAEEINEFHGKLTKALQEKGYVFAEVTFPTRIWAYGIFLAKVDCGPLGTITVKGNRHYSADQIIRSLADQEGARFNYTRVHGDLFDLNAKPDLNIHTQLKPTMQDGRRTIDAELEVEDSLPLHGAFEVSNTGTDHTNDWRFRTTLQHVNLTKHDDVLTADWLTSPDLGDVNALSGAYFLPVNDDYSVNLYGGYSDSNIDDVLPELDIRGRGHYAGAQVTKTLTETSEYRTQLSASWLYQYWETEQDISGVNWQDRRLRLSMPSLTYGYASRIFDPLGGRNYASGTVMANFAGNFGSSEKSEFIGEGGRGRVDGDFVLARFQLARLQRMFRGEDAPGKWTAFMKVDGQVAGDSLPPPVRRSVGGANSVRGYEESEISADNAVVATLELRTPLIRNFIPGLKQDEEFLDANPEAWQRHRLQFVAFADMGWVDNKEALAGEMDNEMLSSAGLGMRLGLTKYSQMRLDYGYAFEETTRDTPDSGRFHLSMQLQF